VEEKEKESKIRSGLPADGVEVLPLTYSPLDPEPGLGGISIMTLFVGKARGKCSKNADNFPGIGQMNRERRAASPKVDKGL
jgi:hypothetical protein